MNRSKRILAIAAIAAALALPPAVYAANSGQKTKIVIQVTDNNPAKWNLALNNAKNLQETFGKKNSTIEVVAYGPGLNMLKFDSSVSSRLEDIAAHGIKIAACGNTMKAMHLTLADLSPAVHEVPAGAVEIVRREREGYAYLHP